MAAILSRPQCAKSLLLVPEIKANILDYRSNDETDFDYLLLLRYHSIMNNGDSLETLDRRKLKYWTLNRTTTKLVPIHTHLAIKPRDFFMKCGMCTILFHHDIPDISITYLVIILGQ